MPSRKLIISILALLMSCQVVSSGYQFVAGVNGSYTSQDYGTGGGYGAFVGGYLKPIPDVVEIPLAEQAYVSRIPGAFFSVGEEEITGWDMPTGNRILEETESGRETINVRLSWKSVPVWAHYADIHREWDEFFRDGSIDRDTLDAERYELGLFFPSILGSFSFSTIDYSDIETEYGVHYRQLIAGPEGHSVAIGMSLLFLERDIPILAYTQYINPSRVYRDEKSTELELSWYINRKLSVDSFLYLNYESDVSFLDTGIGTGVNYFVTDSLSLGANISALFEDGDRGSSQNNETSIRVSVAGRF